MPAQSVPTADVSNAAARCSPKPPAKGIEPQAVVGNYLLTASDETGRWDCHRAWVVGNAARSRRRPVSPEATSGMRRKSPPSGGLRRLRPRKKLTDHREDVLLGAARPRPGFFTWPFPYNREWAPRHYFCARCPGLLRSMSSLADGLPASRRQPRRAWARASCTGPHHVAKKSTGTGPAHQAPWTGNRKKKPSLMLKPPLAGAAHLSPAAILVRIVFVNAFCSTVASNCYGSGMNL